MRLPFTLDPQIIHHVIYNQAGSIGKAIIELIMNSIDAGAAAVQIKMTEKGFECVDDGRGFASREDVLNYFGRFGTPHQEGDATYGRFRLVMRRRKMFSGKGCRRGWSAFVFLRNS